MTSHTTNPDVHSGALQPAVECLLATIHDISECLDASGPELAAPHVEQLARIRKRLAYEPSLRALEEGRDAMHNELTAYAQKARGRRDGCSEELAQILILLAQAGDAFALRRDGYADQFRHFSRLMGQIEEITDPVQVREKLKRQIDHLREFVESVYQENERTFSQIREQVEDYRMRLHRAASPESADAVTGLPGMAELGPQLALRTASGREFCLLRFRLHDAAGIAERYGAGCREELLKVVATALACQIRAQDFVSCWAPDKLLVVMECDSRLAQSRGSQIAQWLSGNYNVESEGRFYLIAVQLAVKVVRGGPEETPESLLAKLHE